MVGVFPPVHQLAVLAFCLLLAWAALSDMRHFLIPNRLVIAIAALYPAHVLASPASIAWLDALAVAAAALAAGLGLFAARAMGGGDVKLIAAIALWAGPALVLPFLFIVALAGGALSLVMLSAARLRPAPTRDAGAAPAPALPLRVPYGVAVAGGVLSVAIAFAAKLRPFAPRNAGATPLTAARLRLPYGAAIATGGLFVAWRLPGI